ncbi:MAG: hypothetical protein MUE40_04365 [Anaerolineae bacterium]|jgi:uncharacterized membrane protein YhiD involved in acid resistance|nr:hypothetical protein [Anaerolineae bacterium]
MEIRLRATLFIWLAFAASMGMLLWNGAATGVGVGLGHVILGVMIVAASIVGNGVVWNWGELPHEASATTRSKGKQKALDKLLEKLDDADLDALRERLMERDAVYGVGDDGELIQRHK